MTEKQKYFEWSDAWVFVALFDYSEKFEPIDLFHIIAKGDIVNRAIFRPEELRQGFAKLLAKGLIEVNETNIRLCQKGIIVKDKVRNGRGGLFTMVDNTLKRMNSPRLILDDVVEEALLNLDFLSDSAIEEGFRKYKAAANISEN